MMPSFLTKSLWNVKHWMSWIPLFFLMAEIRISCFLKHTFLWKSSPRNVIFYIPLLPKVQVIPWALVGLLHPKQGKEINNFSFTLNTGDIKKKLWSVGQYLFSTVTTISFGSHVTHRTLKSTNKFTKLTVYRFIPFKITYLYHFIERAKECMNR